MASEAIAVDKANSAVRRIILMSRRVFGVLALAGLGLAALVHIASLRGIDVEALEPNVWLLHYGLFPVIILAIAGASAGETGTRLTLGQLLSVVPIWARFLMALALGYALYTIFTTSPATGIGDPIIRDGHYYFNDHGNVREVTEVLFHAQRSTSLKLYSAVWFYIYLFAAIYLLAAKPRQQATPP